jgi:hypothetical protein
LGFWYCDRILCCFLPVVFKDSLDEHAWLDQGWVSRLEHAKVGDKLNATRKTVRRAEAKKRKAARKNNENLVVVLIRPNICKFLRVTVEKVNAKKQVIKFEVMSIYLRHF